MDNPQTYGIGAIAIAIVSGTFAFLWKIWKETTDSNKETQKLLVDIVQKTSTSQTELTEAIRQQSNVLSKQDATLTMLLATLGNNIKKKP